MKTRDSLNIGPLGFLFITNGIASFQQILVAFYPLI